MLAEGRRKVLDLIVAQALPIATSMGMLLATASLLGPSGRGDLALVVSTATLLSSVCFLSLHAGAAHGVASGDFSAPKRVLFFASAVSAAMVLLGIVVYFSFPDDFRIGGFTRESMLLSSVGGALSTFYLVAGRTRQGLGESRVFRNASIAVAIGFASFGLPAAFLFRTAVPVVLAWFMALCLGIGIVVLSRSTRERGVTVLRTSFADLLRRSLSVHVGVVGQQLLFRADVVVLGLLATPAAVGVYSVAAPIAGLAWIVTEALSLLAFDRGIAARAGGSELKGSLIRLNFLLASAVSVLVIIVSAIALPALLPDYSHAVLLIAVLLPGIVVQGYARIVLAHLSTQTSARPVVWIGIVSAILSLVYIPFVLIAGALGAAIASSTIYVLQSLIVWIYVRKQLRNGV